LRSVIALQLMIKIKLFILICLATIPFLYLNCSGDDSSLGAIQIPTANVECSSLAAGRCNAFSENKLLFVGITDDTTLNCSNQLSGIPEPQLHQQFLASSSSVTQFDTTHFVLTTKLRNWVAPTQQAISVLEDKEYLFCGFIDSNNDTLLNAGEPILNQKHLLSDLQHINLENWNDN